VNKKDWEKTEDKKKMEMAGRARLAMEIANKQNPRKGDEGDYMSKEAEALADILEADLRSRPGKVTYRGHDYKKGGKVKKAASKPKVRGCGIAKRGVKKCKMR
jgi:hypothetical protein